MKTRTTTIRIHDAQLRFLEQIAEHDGVAVADVQRAAFRAYSEARAKTDPKLAALRDRVAEEWKDEDDARRRETLQRALGEGVE
jgi:hypothetical protein